MDRDVVTKVQVQHILAVTVALAEYNIQSTVVVENRAENREIQLRIRASTGR